MTSLSVIIPVKNEADNIVDLLESLFHQTRKPDEVVILDAGSEDNTKDVIRDYNRTRGYPIKLIEERHAFPGKARNMAIAHSTCDVIAMIDAGCIAHKDWLSALTVPFADPTIEFVWGGYRIRAESAFQKYYTITMIASPLSQDDHAYYTYSFISAALRRDTWQKLKGFPENLRACEDTIMRGRIDDLGIKTAIAPQAIVYWNMPTELRTLFYKVFTYSKYRTISNTGIFDLIKTALFYTVLTPLLFTHYRYWALCALAIYLVVSTVKGIRRHGKDVRLGFDPHSWMMIGLVFILIDITKISGFVWALFSVPIKGRNL